MDKKIINVKINGFKFCVPSKWICGHDDLIVSPLPNRSLMLCHRQHWECVVRNIKELPVSTKQEIMVKMVFERVVVGNYHFVDFGENSNIILPGQLASFAKIDDEILFVYRNKKCAEIWSPDVFLLQSK